MRLYKINNRCLNNNKGIALIEFLIGLSLLAIVISIAYSLYFFGTTSFSLGTSRGDIQQNARMVANFITSEVRFAETMEILESDYNFEDLDVNYHYIFLDNTSIMYQAKGEDLPVVIFSNISQKVDFGLAVKICDAVNNSNDNVLEITVSASDAERSYDVKTEILILNLVGKIIPESGTGIGIRYQLPEEL